MRILDPRISARWWGIKMGCKCKKKGKQEAKEIDGRGWNNWTMFDLPARPAGTGKARARYVVPSQSFRTYINRTMLMSVSETKQSPPTISHIKAFK